MLVAVPKKSTPFGPSDFHSIVCAASFDEGAKEAGALLPKVTGEIVSESTVIKLQELHRFQRVD